MPTLVSRSIRMRNIQSDVERCARVSATVLLQGETGTGKSSLARSIHALSTHAAQPFVTFDCSSVAHSLIESALFGHEKGAFTGAHQRQLGALEQASEGTLFIDELTELPLDLQPKLLRALEEREFSRLGSLDRIAVRCRIVAACQHDLWGEVQAGKFRSDLYFRLAVMVVCVPALREQQEILPELVNEIFDSLGSATRFSQLDATTKDNLLTHDWPGNVRELRNHLERWLLMPDSAIPGRSSNRASTRSDLAMSLDLDQAYATARDECVQQFERAYLERLMERAKNNVSHASQVGAINRRHLYDLLKKHGFK